MQLVKPDFSERIKDRLPVIDWQKEHHFVSDYFGIYFGFWEHDPKILKMGLSVKG